MWFPIALLTAFGLFLSFMGYTWWCDDHPEWVLKRRGIDLRECVRLGICPWCGGPAERATYYFHCRGECKQLTKVPERVWQMPDQSAKVKQAIAGRKVADAIGDKWN